MKWKDVAVGTVVVGSNTNDVWVLVKRTSDFETWLGLTTGLATASSISATAEFHVDKQFLLMRAGE